MLIKITFSNHGHGYDFFCLINLMILFINEFENIIWNIDLCSNGAVL